MEKKIIGTSKAGDDVVLRLEDGQEVRWSAKHLPADIGTPSSIRIVTHAERQRSQSELAASVLSELLRPSGTTSSRREVGSPTDHQILAVKASGPATS